MPMTDADKKLQYDVYLVPGVRTDTSTVSQTQVNFQTVS